MTAYVVGLLMDDQDRVLLIRKARPAWQAGKLNGIGGHIEAGETAAEAMRREFHEEAGLNIDDWEEFLLLTFPSGQVTFFRAFADAETFELARTVTDEAIERWRITDLLSPGAATIPNLRWILPLAAHTHDQYEPMLAVECELTGAKP